MELSDIAKLRYFLLLRRPCVRVNLLNFLKKRLLKSLLDCVVVPLDVESDSLIFQQDKFSVHTSIDAKDYFEDRGIYIFPWFLSL